MLVMRCKAVNFNAGMSPVIRQGDQRQSVEANKTEPEYAPARSGNEPDFCEPSRVEIGAQVHIHSGAVHILAVLA